MPQHGYEFEKVQPILNMESLKKQWNALNTLLEVEMASKVLAGAQLRASGTIRRLHNDVIITALPYSSQVKRHVCN